MKFVVVFAVLTAVATAENVSADARLLNVIGALWNLMNNQPSPILVDQPVIVVDQPIEPVPVGPGINDIGSISVGPAIVDQVYEPISVGPAIINPSPVAPSPVVPSPVVPSPVFPAFPAFTSPLVQLVVNVQVTSGESSVTVEDSLTPEPVIVVPEAEIEATPVEVVEAPVDVVEAPVVVEPVIVSPVIIPGPVVSLPDILN